MSGALTILLLTIADRDDSLSAAVARATREALGGEAQIISRSAPALPGDAEAASLGNDLHADAVVELAWSSTEHLHATIHFRRATSARWVDRDIGFRPADDPGERSRTIGFTVASMMPERFNQPAPAAAAKPEPLPPSVDEGARPALPERSGGLPNIAVTGAFVAALAVRDYGGGVGGSLDLRGRVGHTLSLRLGGGARTGDDAPAAVTSHFFYGAMGLAYDGWIAQNARAALGLRLDVLAMRADFSHASPSGVSDHQGKWLPGADLMVESTYYFARGLGLVLGAGAGVVFGKTDIIVGGQRTTTLEPARPLFEAGFRAGF
jgi:hypothetical protein